MGGLWAGYGRAMGGLCAGYVRAMCGLCAGKQLHSIPARMQYINTFNCPRWAQGY